MYIEIYIYIMTLVYTFKILNKNIKLTFTWHSIIGNVHHTMCVTHFS